MDRKKRKEIAENFCFQETNNMVVGRNEILHAIGKHNVFHSFVVKACQSFLSEYENKGASLSRVQTFTALKVPVKYFSAKESLLYAFNSYVHGYNLRKNRSWRMVAFLKSASEDKQTKDLSFFLSGVMAFNDSIARGVNVNKVELASQIFDQIDEESSIYEVSLIFKATCKILNSDFSGALKIVQEGKEISDNLVFRRFEKNLGPYLSGAKHGSEYEYLKIVS